MDGFKIGTPVMVRALVEFRRYSFFGGCDEQSETMCKISERDIKLNDGEGFVFCPYAEGGNVSIRAAVRVQIAPSLYYVLGFVRKAVGVCFPPYYKELDTFLGSREYVRGQFITHHAYNVYAIQPSDSRHRDVVYAMVEDVQAKIPSAHWIGACSDCRHLVDNVCGGQIG